MIIQTISEHIVRLSAKHGVDPFAVIGLLALYALADVDFARIRFWKDVSEALLQSGLAA